MRSRAAQGLTARTRRLLPLIEAEWAATDLATAELEAELPAALGEILLSAERTVVSRPMRTRISEAARTLHAALPPGDLDAGLRAALLAIAGEGSSPDRPACDTRALTRPARLRWKEPRQPCGSNPAVGP